MPITVLCSLQSINAPEKASIAITRSFALDGEDFSESLTYPCRNSSSHNLLSNFFPTCVCVPRRNPSTATRIKCMHSAMAVRAGDRGLARRYGVASDTKRLDESVDLAVYREFLSARLGLVRGARGAAPSTGPGPAVLSHRSAVEEDATSSPLSLSPPSSSSTPPALLSTRTLHTLHVITQEWIVRPYVPV